MRREPRSQFNINKVIRDLNNKLNRDLRFPKECTCKTHKWHGVPANAKHNELGIWLDCPNCGSTALLLKEELKK